MCRYLLNRHRRRNPKWPPEITGDFENDDIRKVHQSIPEYAPTPLVSRPDLAERLELGSILIKDESFRFGLKAFKALGAAYAIYRFLKEREGSVPPSNEFYRRADLLEPNRVTFTTATDGNHGRGVAWIAKKLKQRAVIYMPENSVPARVENVRHEKAEVIIVAGSYDRAVERCRADAVKHDRVMISDTSWVGYNRIPRWIQAGYRTMFEEITEQSKGISYDLVVIQGGVGALPSAGVWYINWKYPGCKIVIVEPDSADCLFRSASDPEGKIVSIPGSPETIMAGLNCGTPSATAWPIIKSGSDLFLTISDRYSRTAIRWLYDSQLQVVSGESGAAGLGGLIALCQNEGLLEGKKQLILNKETNVLLLNTEGDTDPDSFEKILRE